MKSNVLIISLAATVALATSQWTQEQADALLDQAAIIQHIGIMGESTQENIALDGLETPVALTTFGLSGSQGSITTDPVLGTITFGESGLHQVNMFVGVTEDLGTKDWELQLYWKINSTYELIDAH